MELKLCVTLVLSSLALYKCDHLIMGDVNGKILLHHSTEQYNAIPFTKRVKNVFYNDEKQRIINSIVAYDNLHSDASATVTAGGVGFTFVNIRMSSERGVGLDYDIGIYS